MELTLLVKHFLAHNFHTLFRPLQSSYVDGMVVTTPCDELAIRTEAGAATRNPQIDHTISIDLNRNDGMPKPHSAVNRCHNPLSIRRPIWDINVMYLLVSGFAGLPTCDVVDEQALTDVVLDVELAKLHSDEGNLLTIRTPTGLAGLTRDSLAMTTIDLHHINVANRLAFCLFITNEREHRAVGRSLRIKLMLIRRIGQISNFGTVRIHYEQFPIVTVVGFEQDSRRIITKFLAKTRLFLRNEN